MGGKVNVVSKFQIKLKAFDIIGSYKWYTQFID